MPVEVAALLLLLLLLLLLILFSLLLLLPEVDGEVRCFLLDAGGVNG